MRAVTRLCWILLFCFSMGCAGSKGLTLFSGSCGLQHDGCVERCESLQDARECRFSCDFRARRCEQAQGGSASGVAEDGPLNSYEVAIVDLMGKRPLHSKSVKVALTGASHQAGGHVFAPGGTLKLDISLPASAREAELMLTHAPEGDGTTCFVTMTFAGQTLVGRYAPPKSDKGRARVERWNLTPHLKPPTQDSGTHEYTLFIYNNQNAGSTQGYRLAGVELYYQVEGD